MPMLSELQQRFSSHSTVAKEPALLHETIVSDIRSGLNSKEMLEVKFGQALLREEARGDHFHGIRPRPR